MADAIEQRSVDPIDVRDDGTHEHGREPGWSERIAFAFFDPAAGFGGVARVELRPGDGAAEGSLNVFIPDGVVATVLAREETPGGGSHVGRIHLDRFEPLERWRLRCKDVALLFPASRPGAPRAQRTGAAAPIDMDLAFEAWSPPAGSASRRKTVDDLGFVQVVSSGHFEQAGRYSGRLRIGGRAATLEGAGVRARSWGARDATARHAERWFAVSFGPALAMGLRVVTLGERTMRHGWIAVDGELRDLGSLHLETEMAGRSVARVRLEVADGAGDRYALEGETLQTIPLRDGAARVAQAMTLFRADGREALGLAEYLEA